MNTNVSNEVVPEVDIVALTEQGKPIPAANRYKVRIDEREFILHTRHPTVEQLLALVDRRLCAFELIELLHCDNREVEPGDAIDLHEHGLRGFISARREIVTIYIKDGTAYPVRRGEHSIDQILGLVGETSAGYTLYVERNDCPPMPIPEGTTVDVLGCEVFTTQVKEGKSS